MSLSDSNKLEVYEDGFTIVPNAVEEPLRRAALRTINKALAQGMSGKNDFVDGIQFPSLSVSKAITDLYNASACPSIFSTLVGSTRPIHFGQIALRFPGDMCMAADASVPKPYWPRAWHIDGLSNADPHSTLHHPGRIDHFTALVGVALCDISVSFMGNLVVFPRSHHATEQYFRTHGCDTLAQAGNDGMPKDLPLSQPKMLCLRAGDITIAHYNLAHSIAPNTRENIRYVVYFRVKSANFATEHEFRREALTDIWRDWAGLQLLIQRHKQTIPQILADPADIESATLLQSTEQLFKATRYGDVRPLFVRLTQLRPNDPLLMFHAASAFTWGADCVTSERGEEYCRRAVVLCPIAETYALLAQNLEQQQKYREAAEAAEAALNAPKTDPDDFGGEASAGWMRPMIVNALRVAEQSLAKIGRGGEVARVKGLFQSKYGPAEAQRGASGGGGGGGGEFDGVSLIELWRSAGLLLKSPTKDWQKGRALFTRICELQDDSWAAHAFLGACHVFQILPGKGRDFGIGEHHLRRAVELDSTQLIVYSTLARCCYRQSNYDGAVAAVSQMLTCELDPAEPDHIGMMLDGLKAAKQSLGYLKAPPSQYEAFAGSARTKWPHLSARIDAISSGGCSIM